MKWTIWISILLLCLTGIGEVQAQNDPVLAGMIAVYTEKAEKELKNQEKVLALCEAVGASVYVNTIGGMALYSKEIFQARGVDLKFIRSNSFEYPQLGDVFDDHIAP